MVQDNLIHASEWTYLDQIPILPEKKKVERYKVILIEFEKKLMNLLYLLFS